MVTVGNTYYKITEDLREHLLQDVIKNENLTIEEKLKFIEVSNYIMFKTVDNALNSDIKKYIKDSYNFKSPIITLDNFYKVVLNIKKDSRLRDYSESINNVFDNYLSNIITYIILI